MTDNPDLMKIPTKSMFKRNISVSLKDVSLNTVGSNLCRPNEQPDCNNVDCWCPKHNPFDLSKSELCSEVSSLQDVTPQYGVTLSICPTKKMNKKFWKSYTNDEQRKILTRIEKSYRDKTPSVQLKRIEYEIQPGTGNIHFHALYEMPEIFVSDMEAYYDRVCSNVDVNTKSPYRHWNAISIYNIQGWIDYITKDQLFTH